MSRPLCVLLPEVGVVSETFLRWDVRELLPGATAVVVDPPPAGETMRQAPAWDVGDCPALVFTPEPGDPAPSPLRQEAVAGFLAAHQVEVVLVEYLDFADRWFDFLRAQGVRLWLRGHGVDLSARLTQPYWRTAYRRYADADGILVPSNAAATTLRRLDLPEGKVHVVRNSVEIPPPTPRDAGHHGVVRCVAVGRLVAKKGPLLVLAAFRAAASQNPHLTLDLVGDGPLREEVSTYVADHDLGSRVRMHGQLPHAETLRLIRTADLLLHHAVTSSVDGDAEGQPLVVLEAMAAGVPVIATDHAGIPEVVTDGVNGRLIAERDVAGMARVVLELAPDPAGRARLGRAARATIARQHSASLARRTLLEHFRLTDSAIARRGRPG